MIKWPEREQLSETTPLSFRRLFTTNSAVIVVCFEVYSQCPTNLKARAQTWSSYKHHNTVKFLIRISPQGVISFISKAWGGRASDKYITENCSLLQYLLPGDIILAYCGFDIGDSVRFYHLRSQKAKNIFLKWILTGVEELHQLDSMWKEV